MDKWGRKAKETILVIRLIAFDPLFHNSSIPSFPHSHLIGG
jgi:hypothetical protein